MTNTEARVVVVVGFAVGLVVVTRLAVLVVVDGGAVDAVVVVHSPSLHPLVAVVPLAFSPPPTLEESEQAAMATATKMHASPRRSLIPTIVPTSTPRAPP
jgi:hypothetical protein